MRQYETAECNEQMKRVAEKAAKIKDVVAAYNAGRVDERTALMSMIQQAERVNADAGRTA